MTKSKGATPGAILSATPGATPRQPPANGGATHTPYTPGVAPALGGGVHATNQVEEALSESAPTDDNKLPSWLVKILVEGLERARIEAALIEKENQKWLQ